MLSIRLFAALHGLMTVLFQLDSQWRQSTVHWCQRRLEELLREGVVGWPLLQSRQTQAALQEAPAGTGESVEPRRGGAGLEKENLSLGSQEGPQAGARKRGRLLSPGCCEPQSKRRRAASGQASQGGTLCLCSIGLQLISCMWGKGGLSGTRI